MSAHALAQKMIQDVYTTTGITATAGIGTNMYLAKVALDILAKKSGYYYLNEDLFRKKLLYHKPITDFWQIASGISSHLARLGIYTMADILDANYKMLENEFGKCLASELIMHARGKEEVTLESVKDYIPVNKSLSRSQILFEDYKKEEAIIPLLEMTYLLCIKMCKENIDAKGLSFYVGYSKEIGLVTSKQITFDFRLRDFNLISKYLKDIYLNEVMDLPIRSIGIAFFDIRRIENRQMNLFYKEDERHIVLSALIDDIHQKYGKNSVLPGISILAKSTMRYRNKCIGGHNGE
jgi:DNA polymerase V